MYMRSGVELSYDLHRAVEQHMENIVAHPHLSNIRVRSEDMQPVPCKCACQAQSAGMPKGPCDPLASETVDFLGKLPGSFPTAGRPPLNFSVAALTAANINP